MSLPRAGELFGSPGEQTEESGTRRVAAVPDPEPEVERPAPMPAQWPEKRSPRRSSGRVRHDEKVTVYVTADELVDIEHARLTLRRDHGLAVDRGRLVREALAITLADMERRGGESVLVRRLFEQ
ncbi:MAG: hypothetical protein M3Z50_10415 [Actinomycetota bacterium]|nr:hypothetical protein [Actinomycetota bacterium]